MEIYERMFYPYLRDSFPMGDVPHYGVYRLLPKDLSCYSGESEDHKICLLRILGSQEVSSRRTLIPTDKLLIIPVFIDTILLDFRLIFIFEKM